MIFFPLMIVGGERERNIDKQILDFFLDNHKFHVIRMLIICVWMVDSGTSNRIHISCDL